MPLMKPAQPEFDVAEWLGKPQPERVKAMCQTWAMQGFGAPAIAYVFYVVKMIGYAGGWLAFACATPGLNLSNFGSWWYAPVAFEKAVVWTLLFEILGLGCGSGPLTGRYIPPVTAFTHWLRPGTVRLPPFPKLPLTGGTRRSAVDALLFAAVLGLGFNALVSRGLMSRGDLIPLIAVMVALGLRDKTAFLAGRSEQYLPIMLWSCLLAGSSHFVAMVVAFKVVIVCVWIGAGVSKFTPYFEHVVPPMVSNSPSLPIKLVKRLHYRNAPEDMLPSRLSWVMAHVFGTLVEVGIPLILLVTTNATIATIGAVCLVVFHLFITSTFPLAVPLEWNVFFAFAALNLWIGHDPSARWVFLHQSNAARAGSRRPATVSAIAFSTWSHGSVWPPSDHGMAPEGSWIPAIDCAV